LYECNKAKGKAAHGFSLGYISTTSSTATISGEQSKDHKLTSLPVYYAPKYFLGGGSFKGFIKGALGMHFSNYERTGPAGILTTNYTGFYGEASLGADYSLGEKIFLNLEYEWANMSNSAYRDGFMNTAMAGIGFKF